MGGNEGVLGKTQSVKEKTKMAEIEEKIRLAVAGAKTNEKNIINKEHLINELNYQLGAEGEGWTKTEIDDNMWEILKDEYACKIDFTTGKIGKMIKIVLLDVTEADVKSNIEIKVDGELDISKCITNRENIEKFTITNVTDNLTIKSNTKISATEEGNAKLTIQGIKSGTTKEITLTVVALKIGTYVNYGVTYKDVYSKTEYKNTVNGNFGWRILDIGNYNPTTNTYTNTKIISTGIPAVLHYNSYDISKYVNNGKRKMGRK